MTYHGPYLSTWVWLMLQVLTRFPRTWLTRYNIVLDMGSPKVIDLETIPYYVSVRDVLNLQPIDSDPWSYVISIGIGYLYSHVVSTKFAIVIAL